MKIIHIAFSLGNGGKENMMVDIANEQQRQGHHVAIIVVNRHAEQSILERIEPGIPTFFLQRKPQSKSILPFARLFFILRIKYRADVIHSHDPHLGNILKRMTSLPLVLTIHGMEFETGSMKCYQKLFAISNAVRNDIKVRGSLDSKVIYNGIDTKAIKQRGQGQSKNGMKIIVIKRLNHLRTGQDILIHSMNKLVNEEGVTAIHADLVGDGPSYNYLQQLIDQFKLSSAIELSGNKRREWIYSNLCEYDLLVLPSRFEGFGLAIAEAMAARLPVVVSDLAGPAEVISGGQYGLQFETGNADDLARKIREAINFYQTGKMNEMTESAYTHCVNNFDIRVTARNYCQSYLS